MTRIDVRNILLPGLYGQGTKDIEFDIMPERETNGLRVVGYNMATRRVASFDITPQQIESGAYKAAFNPGLQKLKGDLGG